MNECEYLLTVLVEECAEVAQRACKAMRFGLAEIQAGQPDDNKRRLERELADLVATADLLGLTIYDEDKAAKIVKLKKYMQYSKEIGTLEVPDGNFESTPKRVTHCLSGKDGCTSGATSCSCPCWSCDQIRNF